MLQITGGEFFKMSSVIWQEQVIRDYFSAWLLKEGRMLETVFSENIRYSECYGPEYHGIKQVRVWFADWNKRGTVLEWTIKRFVHQECITVAEWFFQCEYDNTVDGFDGVSIIKFDANGKIEELREFQSKSEHCFPYGYIASDAILETDRLYLREMKQSDYASLCSILQDEAVMYAYEGAFSDAEVQAWLEKQVKNYEVYGFGLWAVVLKETHAMIGQCGLTMQVYGDKQVLEVGYLLQKAFWHQGFAAEAAIACRNYAFEKLGTEEVFSIIRDTNIASQNVAKRNGMTVRDEFVKHYRGVEMPHFVFSVKDTEVVFH